MPLNTNCFLTEGLELTGCTKSNVGGVETVYIANFKQLVPGGAVANKFVYDDTTTGQITSITGLTGTTFYQFDTVKETSSLAEAINVNVQNGTLSFVPTISLVMNKLDTAKRNLIHMLATGLLIAVVKDNNGKYWMAGYTKGLDVTAVEAGTGTALGDRNGATVTLTGAEKFPIAELSGAPVGGAAPTGAVAQMLALAGY
jgi:hypothetical protein